MLTTISVWCFTIFSKNGSTTIEIVLKMAFYKFSLEHGLILDCHEDATDENSSSLWLEITWYSWGLIPNNVDTYHFLYSNMKF